MSSSHQPDDVFAIQEKRSWRSLSLIALSLVNYFLFTAVNIVLARNLSVADFGDYMVAVAALSTLSTFATLGLEKLALKVLPAYRERGDWALSRGFLKFSRRTTGGLALLSAIALVTALLSAHYFVGREYRTAVLIALAFLPIISLFLFDIEIATAYGRQVQVIAIYRVLLPVAILSLNLLIAVSAISSTKTTAVLCYGTSWCIGLIAVRILLARCIPADVRVVSESRTERGWVRGGTLLMAYSLLLTLQAQAGVIVLELLDLSETVVAEYVVAIQVGSFVVLIATSTNRFYLPQVSVLLVRRDESAIRKLAWRRLKLFLVLSVAFTATIFLYGRQILSLYGPEYTSAYSATCVIAVGASVTTLFSVAPYFMQFIEREMLALVYTAVATAVSIVLQFLLGYWYGAVGAAFAYTIPMGVLFVVMRLQAEIQGPRAIRDSQSGEE